MNARATLTEADGYEALRAHVVQKALAARALYLSSGDFYAWTVIERLGHAADGVVRAGAACYTTEEEVDRLVEAVAEIASRP